MVAESSNMSGRNERGRRDYVEEMLKNLKLHDSKLNDVFMGKEEVGKLPSVKLMAVAKVLTCKGFSPELVERTMTATWNSGQEISFHVVEKNLFTLQARCLGD
jgi:hypothetical protein